MSANENVIDRTKWGN